MCIFLAIYVVAGKAYFQEQIQKGSSHGSVQVLGSALNLLSPLRYYGILVSWDACEFPEVSPLSICSSSVIDEEPNTCVWSSHNIDSTLK